MKNEDLETAERQNRFLVYGTAGPDKIKVRGSIGIALMGGNYIWTMSKLISATAFPIQIWSVIILGSNRNTSRRVWEKLSDRGESHNARLWIPPIMANANEYDIDSRKGRIHREIRRPISLHYRTAAFRV